MKKTITHFSLAVLCMMVFTFGASAGGGLTIDAGADVNGCPDDTLMLVVDILGATPPVTVNWAPSTNLTDPTNDTTYVVVGATDVEYIVTVSDMIDTLMDTIIVNSVGLSVDAGPDQTIQCGSTVNLSAFPFGETSSVTYAWSNGDNGFFISNVPVGGYAVTATNSFGCQATDEVNLYQGDLGQDVYFLFPSVICKDSAVWFYNASTHIDSLAGFAINSWTWDFGNSTTAGDFDSASVTFNAVGSYEVSLTMTLGPCNISYTQFVQVQDCGVGNACVPDNTLTEPGLNPDQTEFPCADRGVYFDEVIQFVNFDTVEAFGDTIIVNWIIVKSIFNLPCGLTWEMDRPDNYYEGAEQGCINIYGTTTDSVGQYPLEIFIDANISGFAPFPITLQNTQASLFGLGYNVRVKNDGDACWELDTGFVNYDSLLACNGGGDTLSVILEEEVSICPGASVQLNASAVGGNGPYTYRWSPAAGLSCTFCADPVASPTVATTYTVEVNDILQKVGSNSVHVDVSQFEADLGTDTINLSCGIFNIDLEPVLTGDAAAPLTYAWSNASTDSAINVEAGNYSVTVTNTYGCTAADDVVVTVDSALSFDAGDDTVYCDTATQTVALMPNILTDGSGNYVYTWTPSTGLDNPAIFNPTATFNDDVTYTLTIDDMNNGCSFTDSLHFEFFYLVVDAGADIDFDGSGTQTLQPSVDTLRAAPDQLKYTWSPTVGLSDHTIKNPTLTNVTDTTVYTLTVSNLSGDCSFSDDVLVAVPVGIENIPLNAYVRVYPNPTDGQLTVELFDVVGNSGTIRVFNAQGQLMRESSIDANRQTYQLDMSAAAKGVYFMNIETPKGTAVKRITIQ